MFRGRTRIARPLWQSGDLTVCIFACRRTGSGYGDDASSSVTYTRLDFRLSHWPSGMIRLMAGS